MTTHAGRQKGEMTMTEITRNRIGPAVMTLVLAAVVLISGVAETWADSPYAIRDPKVPRNLSPAARARLQRTAAIKKKQDARKFMLETIKGEQQNGPKK
jgi:hypothetical protein